MPHDQRINLLISLKLSGEASPEELKELERLINENPELLERIETIKQLSKQLNWRSTGRAEESFEKHLHRLNEKIFESNVLSGTSADVKDVSPVRKLVQKKYYRILSGVAAVSILLFWSLFRSNGDTKVRPINNTVSTKVGDKANINLPDR